MKGVIIAIGLLILLFVAANAIAQSTNDTLCGPYHYGRAHEVAFSTPVST